MLGDLSDLRESLFAARLLREEILASPVAPADRRALSAGFLAANGGAPSTVGAMETALSLAAGSASGVVTEEHLVRLASASGAVGFRSSAGSPFLDRAAPKAREVPALLKEILQSVNKPTAMEGWPPPVRAAALHFLLRLVQPFEGDPGAVAFAAEAMLLAADGFTADRLLLPAIAAGSGRAEGPADADRFVRARVHALVEGVGAARDRVREATGRGVMLAWVDDRASGLNRRQRHLVRFLAEGGGERTLEFRDYVGLHAGRSAPSLRTLQRDWRGLREGGYLEETDRGARLSIASLAFGGDATG